MSFYVYIIEYDIEVFGIFATAEEAEASLERQTEAGGPAWEDCKVQRIKISGEPELVDDGGRE